MNICSTCQGAQTECQERLDANADYRAQSTRRSPPRACATSRACTNKNFLWLLVEEIGLDDAAREGHAAADEPARRPLLRLLHRAPDASDWGSTTSTRATATSSR